MQPTQGVTRQAPDSFADLAERVSVSVVNITTKTRVDEVDGPALPRGVVPEGSPFEDFFRQFRDRNRRPGERNRPRDLSALGSGFVISGDGYIVTNNHVIDKADSVAIEFIDGTTLDAEVVGTDPKTDIALLKVSSDKELPALEFGDSNDTRVGDWVIAVGNPLGQGFSVSAGIVSARNRALSGSYDDFFQTDAAINRGNSGGPLFNLDGDVIGVNTSILSPDGGSIGIGFSMASNVVQPVVDQLRRYGTTRRGWLGVTLQPLTEDMIDAIPGLVSTDGAIVANVLQGPASEAGIAVGDIILEFDGSEVTDVRGLVRLVGLAVVGKRVQITVLRDGKKKLISVNLGRREDAEANPERLLPGVAPSPRSMDMFGLKLAPINDQLRREFNLGDGQKGLVVIEVDRDSEAESKDVRAGDVIVNADHQELNNISDLAEQIDIVQSAGRKSVLLRLEREGRGRYVAFGIDQG